MQRRLCSGASVSDSAGMCHGVVCLRGRLMTDLVLQRRIHKWLGAAPAPLRPLETLVGGCSWAPGPGWSRLPGDSAQHVVLPQGPLPGPAPGFNALLIGVWHLRGVAMTFLVFYFFSSRVLSTRCDSGWGICVRWGCLWIPPR